VQAQQTVVASGEEQAQLKEQAQLQFLEQRIRQMHRQQQVCLFYCQCFIVETVAEVHLC
jgi:hypothetical protein